MALFIQLMLLEQTLAVEKETVMEDLTEGMNLSQKEQEVREFLRKETSIEEDKLRLIVIYLVYSKGMKKEKGESKQSLFGG